jgi:hypothetical protein
VAPSRERTFNEHPTQLDYDSRETLEVNKDAQGTSWKIGLRGEGFNGHIEELQAK